MRTIPPTQSISIWLLALGVAITLTFAIAWRISQQPLREHPCPPDTLLVYNDEKGPHCINLTQEAK